MILRQKTKNKHGYYDVYDWSTHGEVREDPKGKYIKVGSWTANFWFHVALGKTEKLTLCNAKKYLRNRVPAETVFEYIEE